MATRRNPAAEKTTSSTTPSAQALSAQDAPLKEAMQLQDVPGYPHQVLWKLIVYSIAVVVLPISAYFYSKNYIFEGNTTYSGAIAALTANVVLISYIILAVREDRGDLMKGQEEKKTK
ncbi:vacuolar ATPase assembly integral membrane protein vma21 [Ophidiomyces ophidiicola]|nr:vacuolar ATPase assembly integral membrane protein vma21 [Ophidiomyces ophidiicola]KAI1984784.1 vacuolar ATPase assembly integral membrane protein vma21 [Ophidiomyces ophidiicola]KAI1992183.1 vacuolar ATPase assembly integral membrane protein vma21 [Ophidiomyces ophidiicola]KAI2003067.1 vacuolar ATPase assembly integral membrane protein vma21 [Ophidiomyces ophidiicola]